MIDGYWFICMASSPTVLGAVEVVDERSSPITYSGSSSFIRRDLTAVIYMPRSAFADDTNVVVIEDARIKAEVRLPGAATTPNATIEIYGMNKMLMNKLTMYKWQWNELTNASIELYANQNIVFCGHIRFATAIYENMPDVPFVIEAMFGMSWNLSPAQTLSFNGPVQAETIARSISNLMVTDKTNQKVTVINNGVNNLIVDGVYPGSPLAKLWKLQKDANIDIVIMYDDPLNTTISLCNQGDWRYIESGGYPVITANTGLIGVPVRQNAVWWKFNSLYNPGIKPRGKVNLQSTIVPYAENVNLTVVSMTHYLESQNPGGMWNTEVTGQVIEQNQ